jgi:anti-sigma regulatory factor (Ser/Thr protein kinase)
MATNDQTTTQDRPADSDLPSDLVLDQPFHGKDLVALRNAVAAHGSRLGLTDQQLADLVLVAQELAANAVRHGAGRGRLRLWLADGHLHCVVTDPGPAGPGLHLEGRQPPPATALGGRGLWLVRQLTHHVTFTASNDGTQITATTDLSTPTPARQ